MTRSIVLSSFVIGQAVVLLIFGLATLWWSHDLMGWLLWMVGEERALGAGNVIHLEGGGKLLTNPSAMFLWGVLPFWIFGAVQILAAFTLVWLWMAILRCCKTRFSSDESSTPPEKWKPMGGLN